MKKLRLLCLLLFVCAVSAHAAVLDYTGEGTIANSLDDDHNNVVDNVSTTSYFEPVGSGYLAQAAVSSFPASKMNLVADDAAIGGSYLAYNSGVVSYRAAATICTRAAFPGGDFYLQGFVATAGNAHNALWIDQTRPNHKSNPPNNTIAWRPAGNQVRPIYAWELANKAGSLANFRTHSAGVSPYILTLSAGAQCLFVSFEPDVHPSAFWLGTTTAAPDAPAVVISGISAGIPATTVTTLSMTTDLKAVAYLEWGPTNAYGTVTPTETVYSLAHTTQLVGLTPNTVYHYRWVATAPGGVTTTTADQQFTTATAPPSGPLISAISSGTPGTTTATITATTSTSVTCRIDHGPTTSYGTNATDSAGTSHTFNLSSLTQNTTYHFILTCNGTITADQTFVTAATVPVVPPVISACTAGNIQQTSVDVTWTTDVTADTRGFFGTTNPPVSLFNVDTTLTTAHIRSPGSLVAATTYYYQCQSCKPAGSNCTLSPVQSFTTTPQTPTGPTISAISSGTPAETTATITWTTNTASSSTVRYGVTNALELSPVTSGGNVTSHSVGLSGLTQNTVYFYAVESTISGGGTTTSGTGQFVTAAAAPAALTISACTAGTITTTGATITFDTNVNGDTSVPWGITQQQMAGQIVYDATLHTTGHSAALTGLLPDTTYLFQCGSAANAVGTITYSTVLNFRTAAVAAGTGTLLVATLGENTTGAAVVDGTQGGLDSRPYVNVWADTGTTGLYRKSTASLTSGGHLAKTDYPWGLTPYVATCTYAEGGSECTPASNTFVNVFSLPISQWGCDLTHCEYPVTVSNGTVTKVVWKWIGVYEGYGTDTVGGRAKTICKVTNLNDTGVGSLRNCLCPTCTAALYPTTAGTDDLYITFTVGGDILPNVANQVAAGPILIRGKNITIDGYTAPPPGITIKRFGLWTVSARGTANPGIDVHDLIIRGIANRDSEWTDESTLEISGLGIFIYPGESRVFGAGTMAPHHVVVDHVSVSQFRREPLALQGVQNVLPVHDMTASWNLFTHQKQSWGQGTLQDYASLTTFHHLGLLNTGARNPQSQAGADNCTTVPDAVTLDHRWNLHGVTKLSNGGGWGLNLEKCGKFNVVGNYFVGLPQVGTTVTYNPNNGNWQGTFNGWSAPTVPEPVGASFGSAHLTYEMDDAWNVCYGSFSGAWQGAGCMRNRPPLCQTYPQHADQSYTPYNVTGAYFNSNVVTSAYNPPPTCNVNMSTPNVTTPYAAPTITTSGSALLEACKVKAVAGRWVPGTGHDAWDTAELALVSLTGCPAFQLGTIGVGGGGGTPPSFDYSLTANPSSVSVATSGTVTTVITATLVAGSGESISFAASGLPTGVTAGFSPATCTTSCTTTLTLTSSSAPAANNAIVTITGTSSPSTIVSRTTVSLTVTAALSEAAWWKLDEQAGTTAADATGNSNTGTLTSGPTWGGTNKGVVFDGSNDVILFTPQSNLSGGTGDLSVSVWVKHSGGGATLGNILGTDTGFTVFFDRVNKRVCIGSANGVNNCTTNNTITTSAWHHIVALRPTSGAGATVYVDNVLITGSFGTGTPGSVTGANTWGIGRDPIYATVRQFAGNIDDVRLYKKLLSVAEISALWTGGKTAHGL